MRERSRPKTQDLRYKLHQLATDVRTREFDIEELKTSRDTQVKGLTAELEAVQDTHTAHLAIEEKRLHEVTDQAELLKKIQERFDSVGEDVNQLRQIQTARVEDSRTDEEKVADEKARRHIVNHFLDDENYADLEWYRRERPEENTGPELFRGDGISLVDTSGLSKERADALETRERAISGDPDAIIETYGNTFDQDRASRMLRLFGHDTPDNRHALQSAVEIHQKERDEYKHTLDIREGRTAPTDVFTASNGNGTPAHRSRFPQKRG